MLCTAADYRSRLYRHAEFLVRNIECQFGLLDELFERQLLTFPQCAEIRDQENLQERSDDNKNMQLIKAMLQVTRLRKLENFLASLRDTDQQHVVAYIACNGGKSLLNFLEMLVLIWHFQRLNPHSVHIFSCDFCS